MKFGTVSPWPIETDVRWCMFFNNTPFRVHLASLQAERVTAGAFHPTSTSCSPVERVRPRATSCSPGRTGTAASTSWERTDLRCFLGPATCCAAERRTGRAGGGRASGTTALPSATGPVAALNAAQCGADGNVKAPWTRWIDARLWKVLKGDLKGRRTSCWDPTWVAHMPYCRGELQCIWGQLADETQCLGFLNIGSYSCAVKKMTAGLELLTGRYNMFPNFCSMMTQMAQGEAEWLPMLRSFKKAIPGICEVLQLIASLPAGSCHVPVTLWLSFILFCDS